MSKEVINLRIDFTKFTPDSLKSTFDNYVTKYKSTLEILLEQDKYTWENLVLPLIELDREYAMTISPSSHLSATMDNEEYRNAYNALVPAKTEFSLWIGQHEGYYKAIKSIIDSSEFNTLTLEQQKSLKNKKESFEQSGIALEGKRKEEFINLEQEASNIYLKFNNNVLDEVSNWELLITDKSELDGLPDSALDLLKQYAKNNGKEGYLLTLNAPSYLPVMTYCSNRELRKKLYSAYLSKCSGGKYSNVDVLKDIIKIRNKKTDLLGFPTHAHQILHYTKMVKDPKVVLDFLQEVSDKSIEKAKIEFEAVAKEAKELDNIDRVEGYDLSYYSNKVEEKTYSVDKELLREYFPESKVINGLFTILKNLFNIEFKEVKDAIVYHPDVKYYEMYQNGDLQAGIYFDLYVRQGKRGGAWMNVAVDRFEDDKKIIIPVAYCTCNFNPPVDGKEPLFTTDEITTLFHEMGHCLHLMLTKVKVPDICGVNGVEWDAIEIPSQCLENWAFNKQTVKYLSGNYKTGEALPDDLLNKLIASKNFNSALFIIRQLEFGTFDMLLHSQKDDNIDIINLWNKVRKDKIGKITGFVDDINKLPYAFSHLFSDHVAYSAGYYSYLYSKVMSSDIFERFLEEGIFNEQVSKDYVDSILSVGGTYNSLDNFVKFRGRQPNIDSLLRIDGII